MLWPNSLKLVALLMSSFMVTSLLGQELGDLTPAAQGEQTTNHLQTVVLEEGTGTLNCCELLPGRAYELTMLSSLSINGDIVLAATDLNFSRVRNSFYFTAEQRCHSIQLNADCWSDSNCETVDILLRPSQRNRTVDSEFFSTLVVDPNVSDQYLIEEVFIGSECFNVFNVTGIGNSLGRGTFSGASPDLDFDEGMIIASGDISVAVGPNNAGGASVNLPGNESDVDLANLVTSTVQDASGIEFDFIPTLDVVSFDYIFASEEYEEYVCSQFNDVFGFFITGPNPNGGNYDSENIAIIPGTDLAVAINSVNPGVAGVFGNPANCTSLTNTQYYNANNNDNLQFDGYTDVFTAFAEVVPCETYHIKLVIGDVGDQIFDSGVFFSLGSFQAGGAVEASMVGGIPGGVRAQESCGEDPFLLIERLPGDDASEPLEITFTVSPFSTAIAGLDYEGIDPGLNTVIIPPGVFFIQIPLTIISDGILEGTETIIIDIENSCSCETSTVMLEIIDELFLALSPVDASCGNADGTVIATLLNATPPILYTYTGSDGSSGSGNNLYITDLAAATYDFTYIDAFGCEATAQVTVGTPDGPMISCTPTDEMAPNAADGTVTVNIMGPASPFTLEWSGTVSGDTTNLMEGDVVIDSLAPGEYSLTVTDAGGCSSECTFSVAEVFCPLNAFPEQSDSIFCAGDSTGSIVLGVFAGTPPYSFVWVDTSGFSSTDQNLTGLSAGIYSLTVTDSIGCTFDTVIIITEPGPLVISCSAVGETVPNADDGMATINLSGATAPYALSWTGPSAGDTTNLAAGDFVINELIPGDYSVMVTDANGCTEACSFVIDSVPCTVVVEPVISDFISCFGECTGGITLNIINAALPFDFTWSGPTPIGNEQNPSGLCAGLYSVTMTDANACQFDTSILIVEPSLLEINCVATNETMPNANDGTATVTITGATPTYTIVWTGPVSGNANNIEAGDFQLVDLIPGNYSVLVNDANGCSTQCTFTVEPLICGPVVSPVVSTSIGCFGDCTGAIALTITNALPPYDFVWSGPTAIGNEQNPTGLCAGTYAVSLTDANACQFDTVITLIEPTPLQINCSATDETIPNADNGTATINLSGATPMYEINWMGPTSGSATGLTAGDFMINDLAPGNYSVTVTDANGCTNTCTFNVAEEPCAVVVSPSVSTAIGCFGECSGAIDLAVENAQLPYAFVWSGPTAIGNEQNPSGLCSGLYSVAITDANGCQFDTSIYLPEPSPLQISCSAEAETAPNANDGVATINLSGATAPYELTWSGPISGTATNQSAGDFLINDLPPGNYTVVVTDANGCFIQCSFSVEAVPCTAFAAPEISTPIACFGQCTGGIELTITNAQPPLNFVWSGPTEIGNVQSPIGLCAGAYTVVITDANQCEFSTGITIDAGADYPLAIIADPEIITCNQPTVVIDASSSTAGAHIAYQWYDESNNPIPGANNLTYQASASGTYTLAIIDTLNGCASDNSTTVEANLVAPSADAGTAEILHCNNTELNLDGSNSSTGINIGYRWTSPNGNVLTGHSSTSPLVNAPGQYILEVTDITNGCSSEDAVEVEEIRLESVAFTRSDPSCFGLFDGRIIVDSIHGGLPPYRYSMDGAFFSPFNEFTGLTSGAYSVIIRDALGCEIDINTSLTEPGPLSLYVGEDQIIPLGESVNLSAVVNISTNLIETLNWSNGESLNCDDCLFPIASPLETTTYSARVTNVNGCVATDELTIFVDRSLGVYIPSAFSPNGDGINDVFHVFARDGVERVNELRIFDRWGEQVFFNIDAIPNDPTYGWDGTHRGEPLNPAVFVYWAEVELLNGDIKFYKGDVTLIR